MKRWILWILVAAAAVLAAPGSRTDVAELRPVELLYMYMEEGTVYLQTDTGDLGIGRDAVQAADNLKQTSPGEIFLDTADFLVVAEEAIQYLPQAAGMLRPSAEVCVARNDIEPEKAAEYLAAHSPGVTLQMLAAGRQALPGLIILEERFMLVQ